MYTIFFFQCFENQMQMLFTDHQTILEMTMYKVCTKSLHSKTHPNRNCWWRHDVRLVVSHDCTLLVTCALCMATVWSSWSLVTWSGQSLTSHWRHLWFNTDVLADLWGHADWLVTGDVLIFEEHLFYITCTIMYFTSIWNYICLRMLVLLLIFVSFFPYRITRIG